MSSRYAVHLAGLFSIFLSITTVHAIENHTNSANQFKKGSVTSNDSLQVYARKANALWMKREPSLKFATNFLSKVSDKQVEFYYDLATKFYFWSLSNAAYQDEGEQIKKEAHRIIPLMSDSTKILVRNYIKSENPKIINELIGFWKTNDTFTSTSLNERLIEHWQRINYAQKNFTLNTSSPYDTDERGTYYVRLGPPDNIYSTRIKLPYIVDPLSGKRINFQMGSLVNSKVEVWIYSGIPNDHVLLFGRENGYGPFGARNKVMELFDTNGLEVELGRGTAFNNAGKLKRITKNALKYGAYKKLAPIHPRFEQTFSTIKTRLTVSTDKTLTERFSQFVGIDGLSAYKLRKDRRALPSSKTTLRTSNSSLSLDIQSYQFLSENHNRQVVLSVNFDEKKLDQVDSTQFLNTKVSVYNESWETLSNTTELKKISSAFFSKPLLYEISHQALNKNTYFSAELIDTTKNNIRVPGSINPQTSAILKSTGIQRVKIDNNLNTQQPLLISDIILGKDQEVKWDARIPISPSRDQKYKIDSDMMVYFEVYNIPRDDYSFTYFFKRKRFLSGYQKLEGRSEVTILREKVDERDKQLFTIDLSDLDPDSYKLVFKFSPLNEDSDLQEVTKEIDFEVVE